MKKYVKYFKPRWLNQGGGMRKNRLFRIDSSNRHMIAHEPGDRWFVVSRSKVHGKTRYIKFTFPTIGCVKDFLSQNFY